MILNIKNIFILNLKKYIYFFFFTLLGRLLLLFKNKKDKKPIKNILIVGRGRSYRKILNDKLFLKRIDTICLVNFGKKDGDKFVKNITDKNIIILTNKYEPILYPKIILKLNIIKVIIDILERIENRNTFFSNIYGLPVTKLPNNYKNLHNIKSTSLLKVIIFFIQKYRLKKLYICGLDFYSNDIFGKTYIGKNSSQLKTILRIKGEHQKKFFFQILNKFSNVTFYIHSHASLKNYRNLIKINKI